MSDSESLYDTVRDYIYENDWGGVYFCCLYDEDDPVLREQGISALKNAEEEGCFPKGFVDVFISELPYLEDTNYNRTMELLSVFYTKPEEILLVHQNAQTLWEMVGDNVVGLDSYLMRKHMGNKFTLYLGKGVVRSLTFSWNNRYVALKLRLPREFGRMREVEIYGWLEGDPAKIVIESKGMHWNRYKDPEEDEEELLERKHAIIRLLKLIPYVDYQE